jgi:hypothetical protein
MYDKNIIYSALANIIAPFFRETVGKTFIIPCAHRNAHQRLEHTTWAHGIMNVFPTVSRYRG